MTDISNNSLEQTLSQAQAAMAQMMVVVGKESVTSGKIADTQIGIANQYNTSTEAVTSQVKQLGVLSAVIGGLSGAIAGLNGFAGYASSGILSGGLNISASVLKSVVAPAVLGSLQIVQGKAQLSLGDEQKTQAEYGNAGQLMNGQDQIVIDGESEVAQKAQSISRDLSQIVSDQKQASLF
jgi:hypothetical protein